MKKEIKKTADGSKTIHFPEWNESYHSRHGALQEARHVYLQAGLAYFLKRREVHDRAVYILEYGFGTGLNALLTALHFSDQLIHYTALEKFPVSYDLTAELDYEKISADSTHIFERLHTAAWERDVPVTDNFTLHKARTDFREYDTTRQFDVIYFDAFGPRVQPELWDDIAFAKAYKTLSKGGILTTYCSAGHVKRSMLAAGFEVSKIPGPPGKREMLRAAKG